MHLALFALLLVAAPRPVIETTVKVRKVFSDGTSVIQSTVYHYDYGRFLDSLGRPYAGDDTFVLRLTRALREIEEGGPTGRDLVASLEQDPRSTQIAYGYLNEADMDRGEYVHWDPNGTLSAPDQAGYTHRPAFIGLAHELAHIYDVWRGTLNRHTWRVLPETDGVWVNVPYAELYATHIENKIRSENGIPLRMSYATAIDGDEGAQRYTDRASLLIRPGTRESLYFDCEGHTSYHALRKSEMAARY
ncbi:M91 family zinc metallopeptidase [Dinghuibacter silviterrae]|uniref:NleD-like pathogen effector protein (Putative zinc metallopeptidase) n=1 Tax=Dinghuibacter silviterrae TaxID=1539049 RepID=A0A4R8DWS4_9BACT|nr:M91 family zinc metallopeptidase [Dinghuibacter silviterrae]TDX01975.1 NleD-like pathogen effector protein (putative zinc metallopeptidase) [Dinghuibacter silviterrae]